MSWRVWKRPSFTPGRADGGRADGGRTDGGRADGGRRSLWEMDREGLRRIPRLSQRDSAACSRASHGKFQSQRDRNICPRERQELVRELVAKPQDLDEEYVEEPSTTLIS